QLPPTPSPPPPSPTRRSSNLIDGDTSIADNNTCAFCGKCFRHGCTNASAGAGDDRNTTCQARRVRRIHQMSPVCGSTDCGVVFRSEEHTSELQSRVELVLRLL